ncbi:hypothetical protein [Halolamina salifodinae]|uniref:Uncharacterized protein n=1 Tax=Halolamina salifodinae TaxID=1202767 RepID=A0A8T4GWH5_9EURY|nr:hypothetical protein [Halolamina salifodinae]MBP1987249.1 hypothetical protein [Halolamina salifodinae]
MGLEPTEAVERAERMLKGAYSGLKQFESGSGEEKYLGVYNAVSFGRNLTFALQKATSQDEEFDAWYADRVEVLKEDPVCRHMKDLRNKMEKEGASGVASYASFSGSPSELQRQVPSWSDSIFIGDEWGGSGFTVETDDGEEVKFYMEFEDVSVESGLFFPDLEDGDPVYGDITDAEDDLKYYLKILAELVKDGKEKFGDEG